MLTIQFNSGQSRKIRRWARIGGADHCEIHLAAMRQPVAAVVARYDFGWMIHPVKGEMLWNGHELSGSAHVSGAAVLNVSGISIHLTPEQEMRRRESEIDRMLDAPCIASHQEQGYARTFHSCWTIGRSRLAHFVCSDRSLDEFHAILTRHQSLWYLHCLSPQACRLDQQHVSTYAAVPSGNSILKCGSTEVKVTIEARRTKTVRDTRSSANSAGEASGESLSMSQVETLELSRVDPTKAHCEKLLQRTFHRLRTNVASSSQHLQQSSLFQRLAISCRLRLLENRVAEDNLYSTFRQLESLLQSDPRNLDTIHTAAGICRRFGFDSWCLNLIRLGHTIAPRNVTFCQTLARILEALSESDVRYLDQARNCWRQLGELVPARRGEIQQHMNGLDVRSWNVRRLSSEGREAISELDSTASVSNR